MGVVIKSPLPDDYEREILCAWLRREGLDPEKIAEIDFYDDRRVLVTEYQMNRYGGKMISPHTSEPVTLTFVHWNSTTQPLLPAQMTLWDKPEGYAGSWTVEMEY